MKIRWLDVPADLSLDIRNRVERRVRLVIGRRAPVIEVVSIGLSGPPGQDGPAATDAPALHRCRIRVRLAAGGDLVVDERSVGRDAAIEEATWRLSRRLARLDMRPGVGSTVARGA